MIQLRHLYCMIVGHDWDYQNYIHRLGGSDQRMCWGCGHREVWKRRYMYGIYLTGRWVRRR